MDPEKYSSFRQAVRGFVAGNVNAEEIETSGLVGRELILAMGGEGFLATCASREADEVRQGILYSEFGRSHASLQNLVTVTEMVAEALARFGRSNYLAALLSDIAAGRTVCSFALSEPNAGSDIQAIETKAEETADGSYRLTGTKKWISFAAIADKHLVFATSARGPVAFVVDASAPGLTVEPIEGLLGLRANSLAELRLDGVLVGAEQMVGKEGAGLSQVAGFALNRGRYATAWGCVGMAEACFEAVHRYAHGRKQFGKVLADHQLIQKMISEISVELMSAKLLCHNAGLQLMSRDPGFLVSLLMAKYKASTMVNEVAGKAVQVFGAAGLTASHPVQRFYRDARVMEVIEGTTQLFEIHIARNIKMDFFDEAVFIPRLMPQGEIFY